MRYSVVGRCEPQSCSCNTGTGNNSDGVNIYYKNDFKLNYQFTDSRYVPTILVPPKYIDCIFRYYTYGRNEVYIASHINGNLTNAFINEATNEFKVIFENHGLQPGRLMVEYEFIINDCEFPSGKANRILGQYTGIILTNQLF